MLIRPGPTRDETYCSNDLLKVPRWRRSKFSTAGSWVTPDNACEITPCEIPAACASADIAATKVLKSPPQRAAKQGVAKATAQSSNTRRRTCMGDNSFGAEHHRGDRAVTRSASILFKRASTILTLCPFGICCVATTRK